jgi:hypothetical protein
MTLSGFGISRLVSDSEATPERELGGRINTDLEFEEALTILLNAGPKQLPEVKEES